MASTTSDTGGVPLPAPPKAESVDISGLTELGRGVSARQYLRDIWSRRQYAYTVPMSELRSQNMNTVLGNLWHLLNPLLLVGVYYVVFDLLLNTSRGVDNFLPFLAIGVFSYTFTQKSVLAAAVAITNNELLIRALQFPRAILPISIVVGQTFAFMFPVAVMLALALATGESIRVSWLALGPIIAIQALFNIGAGLFAARMTDSFRDMQQLLPFLFRLAFYGSGVLYSVEAFVSDPAKIKLFAINPMYCYIEMTRWAVMGLPVSKAAIVGGLIWPVVVVVGGFFYFKAGEQNYGRG